MEFKDLTEEAQKLADLNKYDLLRDKAITLKKKGIEACREDATLNIGDIKITNDLLDLIEKGTQQIIDYKGLSLQRPFEGFDVSDFYVFMRLFYLKMCKQKMVSYKTAYIIDKILFRNTLTGDKLWFINKVDKI